MTTKPAAELEPGDVLLKPHPWGWVPGPATVTSVLAFGGETIVTYSAPDGSTHTNRYGSANSGVLVGSLS